MLDRGVRRTERFVVSDDPSNARSHVRSLLSQALSSGRSVGFVLVAAQLLDARDFGLLAIVITLSIGANSLLRAAASHPLALVGDPPDGDFLRSAVCFQTLLAGVAGIVLATIALVAGAPAVLWLGALVFPLVAAQDGTRVSLLNLGRGALAVSADGTWLVLLAGSLAWCCAADIDSPVVLVMLWALAAGVAAVSSLTVARSGSIISPTQFAATFGSVGRSLTGQVVLEIIPTRILPVVVASAVAVEAVGAIRAAEALLGATTVVWSAVALSSLRQARRRCVERDEWAALWLVAAIMTLPIGCLVINLALVWSLSDELGDAILGETWNGAAQYLGPTAVLLFGQIVLGIVSTSLRASLHLDDARRVLALATLVAVVAVPASTMVWDAKVGLVVDGISLVAAAAFGVVRMAGRRHCGRRQDEVRPARAG